MWFKSESHVDLADKALQSTNPSDGVHWLMDEPLVVMMVEEELRGSNADPEFFRTYPPATRNRY